MRILVLLSAMCLLPGCGLLFDGLHAISPRAYDTRETIREPVPGPAGEGEPDPACGGARRPLVRSYELTRHYERQNGWDHSYYGASIAGDTVFAAAFAGTLYATCTLRHDPMEGEMPRITIPCTSLFSIVPLGVDLIYSIARLVTVRPPRLVGKDRSEGRLGPGACPSGNR